jgi:hypothetical protein
MPFQTARGLLPITPTGQFYRPPGAEGEGQGSPMFRDDRTGQLMFGQDYFGDNSWTNIWTVPGGLQEGGEMDMGSAVYFSPEDQQAVSSRNSSHLAQLEQGWGINSEGFFDRYLRGEPVAWATGVAAIAGGFAYFGGEAAAAGAGGGGSAGTAAYGGMGGGAGMGTGAGVGAATTAGGLTTSAAAATSWLQYANLAGLGLTAYGFLQGQEGSQQAANAANNMAAQIQSIMDRSAGQVRDAVNAQTAAIEDQAAAVRERAGLEQKRADIQNARTVRDAVRQSRIARARVMNTGANSGTMGSSAVLGGTGSIQSQLYSDLGYFGQLQQINEDVYATQLTESEANVRGAKAQGRAYIAQGQASAATAVAQGYGQAQMAVAQARGQQGAAFANLGATIFNATGGYRTIFG